jgi:hypothetical protein
MDFSESVAPAGAERKALIKCGEHTSNRLGEEAVGVKPPQSLIDIGN